MYMLETRRKILARVPVKILTRVDWQITDNGETGYVKLFFRNSLAEQDWFDENRTKVSNLLITNIRDKIALHLANDEKYRGGLFAYCDREKLIADVVEFWLKENYPEYIEMSRPKRGIIAVKSR